MATRGNEEYLNAWAQSYWQQNNRGNIRTYTRLGRGASEQEVDKSQINVTESNLAPQQVDVQGEVAQAAPVTVAGTATQAISGKVRVGSESAQPVGGGITGAVAPAAGVRQVSRMAVGREILAKAKTATYGTSGWIGEEEEEEE